VDYRLGLRIQHTVHVDRRYSRQNECLVRLNRETARPLRLAANFETYDLAGAKVTLKQTLVDSGDLSLDIEGLIAFIVTQLEQLAFQAVLAGFQLCATVESAPHLLCRQSGWQQDSSDQDGQE
jgi:hypothetical protein